MLCKKTGAHEAHSEALFAQLIQDRDTLSNRVFVLAADTEELKASLQQVGGGRVQ